MLKIASPLLLVGVLAAGCSQYGPHASVNPALRNPDLGGCSASPINPHRQDQLCNRQNGNAYN
jgi:PBP1b-binding outer membrane lipoprotein LpoB